MTKSFDEWFEEKYLSLSIHANAGFEKDLEVKNIAKSAFTAGQQSKKAEVDELQKRIDNLKSFCIKGVESNMLSIEYNQALIDMHKILKGNNNDH